jgi:predicted RNase H-like HicB family nuclease
VYGLSGQIEIKALVHEEDGSFWAEVPTCPGLFASGDTLDELAAALREAWSVYHGGESASRGGDPGRLDWTGSTCALTLRLPAFA